MRLTRDSTYYTTRIVVNIVLLVIMVRGAPHLIAARVVEVVMRRSCIPRPPQASFVSFMRGTEADRLGYAQSSFLGIVRCAVTSVCPCCRTAASLRRCSRSWRPLVCALLASSQLGVRHLKHHTCCGLQVRRRRGHALHYAVACTASCLPPRPRSTRLDNFVAVSFGAVFAYYIYNAVSQGATCRTAGFRSPQPSRAQTMLAADARRLLQVR